MERKIIPFPARSAAEAVNQRAAFFEDQAAQELTHRIPKAAPAEPKRLY